jgi:hypothetical protein
MTDSIKIIKLDTHPTMAGVRAATIFVHYEDGEATIILRPTAALQRTQQAIQEELRRLANALSTGPITESSLLRVSND